MRGIRGFSKAIEALEAQLGHRPGGAGGGRQPLPMRPQEIFLLNDLDGDGNHHP